MRRAAMRHAGGPEAACRAARSGIRADSAQNGSHSGGFAVIAHGDGPASAEYLGLFLIQQEQSFNAEAYGFASSRQYTAESQV
jgi:hypothetical protein